MSRIWLAGTSALALVIVCAGPARADNISTKKLFIKDPADPAKRQVQVQSSDVGVHFSGVDPSANGASVHVYGSSTTDDYCVLLPGGPEWQNTGSLWKFKSTMTKNSARIGEAKLLVKIKSGVTYSLADDTTQGTVNAQVQFGSGTRYCMRCSGNVKDDAGKFLGKGCMPATCDPEPTACSPPTTSTSTSTSTSSSTSSTCAPPTPPIARGSLTPTPGRFNYNLTLGLPGANAACNTNFACTHACTYTELQAAATEGDLVGLKDTAMVPVMSFWAIDPNALALMQCVDDAVGGSNKNWEYGTAHTASRGEKVALDNTMGTLGPLQTMIQCNIAGTNWVGCCR